MVEPVLLDYFTAVKNAFSTSICFFVHAVVVVAVIVVTQQRTPQGFLLIVSGGGQL